MYYTPRHNPRRERSTQSLVQSSVPPPADTVLQSTLFQIIAAAAAMGEVERADLSEIAENYFASSSCLNRTIIQSINSVHGNYQVREDWILPCLVYSTLS